MLKNLIQKHELEDQAREPDDPSRLNIDGIGSAPQNLRGELKPDASRRDGMAHLPNAKKRVQSGSSKWRTPKPEQIFLI